MGKYLDYNGLKYLWQKAIAKFAPLSRAIPSGGTSGQVLAKSSNSDYAVGWTTPSGGGSVTTLYSNSTGKGQNTSVPLSSSAANFDYLDIIFTDGNRQYTSRLYDPDGKSFSLFRSVCSGSTVYQNTLMGSVSGTSISLGTEASSITTSSATLKVIGVKGGTL